MSSVGVQPNVQLTLSHLIWASISLDSVCCLEYLDTGCLWLKDHNTLGINSIDILVLLPLTFKYSILEQLKSKCTNIKWRAIWEKHPVESQTVQMCAASWRFINFNLSQIYQAPQHLSHLTNWCIQLHKRKHRSRLFWSTILNDYVLSFKHLEWRLQNQQKKHKTNGKSVKELKYYVFRVCPAKVVICKFNSSTGLV